MARAWWTAAGVIRPIPEWWCFHLYVILDVFSRYAVAWTVQHRESAALARALLGQAAEQQQITRGQLTPTAAPR